VRQEKYDDRNPVVAFLVRRFFERIGGVLGALAPESLLDAGCGEGELLRRGALPSGLRPVLLDRRADSAAQVIGSVTGLPFAARSFDVATCFEVLEHLEDPAAAVRELGRVARRAVVVSVPHEPWFHIGNVLRGKHLGALGNYPEHVQHWNFRSLEKFLAPHVAEVRLTGAFPWIIACCALKQR
jgi:ubiquinone/menaquinone biosynthesis C-methylase UbiE